MLMVAMLAHQLHADSPDGEPLRYLVALIRDVPHCIGTLISPTWVLTAAYCLDDTTFVQFGNLSIPFNETNSLRKVLARERPPSSKISKPDLGMILITSVSIVDFGQLSAVDYTAMAGHVGKYTDFSSSQKEYLKEGVVGTCSADDKRSSFTPNLCVAPKCSEKEQLSLPGEPGSPLFYDGKLAGVHVGGSALKSLDDTKLFFLRTYTPISPYLTWIHQELSKKERTYV